MSDSINGYDKGTRSTELTVSDQRTNGYDIREFTKELTVTGPANGYDKSKICVVLTVSKLSKLQRFMLRAAMENRTREGRDENTAGGADLYHSEICVGYFGFPVTEYRRDLRRNIGDHRFDVGEIGKARYASAKASISRASSRLRERGLVFCMAGTCSRWSGITLTSAGIEAARKAVPA